MPNLSNNIYRYYLEHFQELPADKQFHFASRLHFWDQDPSMMPLLASLKAYYTANDKPAAALQAIITEAQTTPSHGSKNAAELRRPYFERYPKLKMYVSVLFRIHFLLTVYAVDCRPLMHELFEATELEQYRTDLLADTDALAILSTHAINFLYLYQRTILHDETGLPIERFLEVGRTYYDFSNKLHLQLFVYLYTHCIIGESRFYYRQPPDNQSHYTMMLRELEKVIAMHYDDINLDNKCEFLVCAKLLGQTSKLEAKIFDEASRSLSDEGAYLIDRHNHNPQTDNVSLDKSEHRNVLFIMANRQFTPVT